MGDRAHEERHRRRDRRDGRAGRAGARRGRRRLHHVADDPAQLAPRLRARHRRPPPDELLAIGDAIGRAGHGVFQLVSDEQGGGDGARVAHRGGPPHRRHRHLLARPDAVRARTRGATRSTTRPRSPSEGLRDRAAGRRAGPPGCCSGCSRRCTRSSPTRRYRALADRPLAERVARAAQARGAGRAAGRGAGHRQPRGGRPHDAGGTRCSRLGDPPDYEPPADASIAAEAARRGSPPAGGRARLAARARRQGASCSRRWPATWTTTTRRSAR